MEHIYQFHCFLPDIYYHHQGEIPLETGLLVAEHNIRRVIAEFVCGELCKVDRNFAQEYLERLFTPEKYNQYHTRQASGWVRIYTLKNMTYYYGDEKSWNPIPPISKLLFNKN